MRCRCFTFGALLGLLAATVFASDVAKPPRLSEQTRRDLIRTFTAEAAFALRFFPMGKIGLKIEHGQVFPSEAEVRQLVADNGSGVPSRRTRADHEPPLYRARDRF